MAILPNVGRLLDLARRIDRLFENIQKLQAGQEVLTDRLVGIERRLSKLEDREELLIEKMSTRATQAATAVMNQNMMDLVRRLATIEERNRVAGGDGPKRIE